MKRSSDRILTTHVGSLARPHELLRLMQARARGEPYDAEEMERAIAASVKDLVKHQVEAGLDIVADGEQSKTGFFHYARERLTGFEVDVDAKPAPRAPEEMATFPEYYERYFRRDTQTVVRNSPLVCTGPVTYVGHAALQRDIDNLRAALEGLDVDEAFIPASAPRVFNATNRYYSTEDEFFEAVGDALREEYRGIVDAGFLLQVDDPALTNFYSTGLEPVEERRKRAERYIELLNYSLRGIPEDRVRFHTCYGINEGPRIFDVPLADIAEFMLKVNAQALSFECANPRHDHEWRIWKDIKLPEGKILIPGVITHTTNMVEHPELVADRLLNYASVAGRENVIAGADCGFSSQATFSPDVDARIVWHKFQALVEGARMAAEELWV